MGLLMCWLEEAIYFSLFQIQNYGQTRVQQRSLRMTQQKHLASWKCFSNYANLEVEVVVEDAWKYNEMFFVCNTLHDIARNH